MFINREYKDFEKMIKEAEKNEIKLIVSGNNEEIEIFPYSYEYRLREFKLGITTPKNIEKLYKSIHKKLQLVSNKEISLKKQLEDRYNIVIEENFEDEKEQENMNVK